MAVLPDLSAMKAEIEALRRENLALRAKEEARRNQPLTCKVTDKGGLSVYGLGRWPVTLYASQWRQLAKGMPEVMAYLEANTSRLSVKGEA